MPDDSASTPRGPDYPVARDCVPAASRATRKLFLFFFFLSFGFRGRRGGFSSSSRADEMTAS